MKIDGKLEEGLKDGRRMIKLDEGRAEGYLRAGKILGLMGRWDSALKLYSYGLKRVDNSEKGEKQRKVS